ncbi:MULTISPECIES: HK97 family phage prohead protease [unclassified Photorhabdus]|uniref:HK97 family phage prohead protease n=1 Tax=unclassified Photorhabdus TaxID=2620880 RepID=UPI000DCE8BD1|nr:MULTISPECIES: HK97 family phage prohead protease [unclassified Photorhabdus]RAW69302.1 HK97 family phage prohead protease [Photorhabdus sp. S14-60]RAW70343.1 HK97 family phage prohead protease [Photorhabdus sp. S7-51]RAW77444.1 HK97 family phage prohead protease [Photorhabdus sp. S15-56]
MNNNFEIRTASLSASDKKLTGYVIKWNSRSHVLWDEFVEQFTPNAFRASLTANTDVRALYEHDHTNLLGRTTSGTLQLSEDATGLRFELTPPDTQLGRDVLTLVERGDISGMSFGFRATKDQWDVGQEPYIRTVLEAELREITITSMPAYPDSGVEIAKRSLNAAKPCDLRHYWLQLSEV